VATERRRFRTDRFNRGDAGREMLRASRDDRERCAEPGELEGDAFAETRPAASDKNHLTIERAGRKRRRAFVRRIRESAHDLGFCGMDLIPVLLDKRASAAPFVTCEGTTRTFAEERDEARRLAGALHSRGVRKGDRVATILPNCIEHVDLIYVCALLGAIHVPVNLFLKGDFLKYQLDDASPSLVIADGAGVSSLGAIGREGVRPQELDGDEPPPHVEVVP